MAVSIPIYDGSPGAISGSTAFGFFDSDTDFQTEGPKFARHAAGRLGYGTTKIEIQSGSLYDAFEEAICEYSAQVNQFNIRDNMLNFQGASTGSDLTQRLISANLDRIITLAKEYGSEAGTGGTINYKSGSIQVYSGRQTYDLDALYASGSEGGKDIEIKRIFHYAPPAITRYFDPFIGTGLGSFQMLETFGWGSYSPGVSFQLMPINADLLRLQAIEFNDQIRKSAYSFELINNVLKVFPLPVSDFKLWFQYILTEDRANLLKQSGGLISDYSNVPYEFITYSRINSIGRQWIYKYGTAAARERLGYVRSKYASIPIPRAEITLNGAELIAQSQTEKADLIAQLRENLEELSRMKQLERKQSEATNLSSIQSYIPLKVYIR